jgi:WD40 repeat protein/Flp pilus assembly protein TadD
MGVVFKATQKSLNREVALKMILAGELASAADVRRFHAEAEAVGHLDHPHIVPIYEVGEHLGLHYFSMKLVEGGNLADPGQPRGRQAVPLLIQVARAVHFAHQRGILHRDLKPANILLDRAGTPFVTDFGLAKRVQGEGEITQSGALMGTPSYMAPEQAAAKKGLTTAVDVYALGAILYFCLTGKPPFQAASALDTVMEVLEKDPIRPRELAPDLDRDLETICLKCLDKEPARRYASAEAFADDLDRWQRGEPIEARPASRVERAFRWCRRNPTAASLIAVAGLLALATLAAVGATVAALRINRALAEARQARQDALEARQLADSKAKIADDSRRLAQELADQRQREERRQAVQLCVNNGVQRMNEGDYLGALPWFTEALERDPRDPDDVHRRRIAIVLRQCPRLLGLWSPRISEADFSPDGNYFYSGSIAQPALRLQLQDSFQGKRLWWNSVAAWNASTVFSKEGAILLALEKGPDGISLLRRWETATGKSLEPLRPGYIVQQVLCNAEKNRLVLLKKSTEKNATEIRLLDFATGKDITPAELSIRKGNLAVFGYAERFGTIWRKNSTAVAMRIWETASGEPVGPVIEPPDQVSSNPLFAFRRDGTAVATAIEQTVRMWDCASGKEVFPAIVHAEKVDDLEFTREGGRLITGSGGKRRWWDSRTGKEIATWQTPRGVNKNGTTMSPDGRFALTQETQEGNQAGPLRLWSWRADRPVTPFLRHAGPLTSWQFAPDGRRLLTINSRGYDEKDGEARIWDLLSPMPPPLNLRCWTDFDKRAALSRDGRLVVARRDKGIQICETATGKAVSPLIELEDVACTGFSNDGKLMLCIVKKRGRNTKAEGRIYRVDNGKQVGKTWSLESLVKKDVVPGFHTLLLRDVALSPDGKQVAVAAMQSLDGHANKHLRLELFDTSTGKRISRLNAGGDNGYLTTIAFSPDGSNLFGFIVNAHQVAGAVGKLTSGLRIWDAKTGEPAPLPFTFVEDQFTHFNFNAMRVPLALKQDSVIFSRDSKRLGLTFGNHRAYVYNLTGKRDKPLVFEHQGRLNHLTFSSDGKWAATAGDDQAARVWDMRTGRPVTPPLSHRSPVRHVAFSPDSRLIGTVTQDGAIQVWSVASNAPVGPPIQFNLTQAKAGPEEKSLVQLTVADASVAKEETPFPRQVVFGNDGQTLVVFSGAQARVIDLRPDPRPVKDLTALAQLLSGHRVDEFGAQVALDGAALREHWTALKTKYPGEFQLTKKELLAWHKSQGERAAERKDWPAAAFHWHRLTVAEPENGSWWKNRGIALAELALFEKAESAFTRSINLEPAADSYLRRARVREKLDRDQAVLEDYASALQADPKLRTALAGRGDWHAHKDRFKEAVADFDKLVKGNPNAVDFWRKLALAQLGANDVPGYKKTCNKLAEHFAKTTSADVAEQVLWTWAIAINSFPDALKSLIPPLLQKSGEVAYQLGLAKWGGAQAPADRNATTTLIAVSYRLRLHDAVLKWMTSRPGDGGPWDQLFAAMAAHEKGQKEVGLIWLKQACKWIDTEGPKQPWDARLELKLLRKEAEEQAKKKAEQPG